LRGLWNHTTREKINLVVGALTIGLNVSPKPIPGICACHLGFVWEFGGEGKERL